MLTLANKDIKGSIINPFWEFKGKIFKELNKMWYKKLTERSLEEKFEI